MWTVARRSHRAAPRRRSLSREGPAGEGLPGKGLGRVGGGGGVTAERREGGGWPGAGTGQGPGGRPCEGKGRKAKACEGKDWGGGDGVGAIRGVTTVHGRHTRA